MYENSELAMCKGRVLYCGLRWKEFCVCDRGMDCEWCRVAVNVRIRWSFEIELFRFVRTTQCSQL